MNSRRAFTLTLTSLVLFAASATMPPTAQQPLAVFPGAEGFGTTTVAGRGGAVLRVTNVNDSGPGSLRAALDTSGPRVIVFETSGTIVVSSWLEVANPYVTIAGQTAPAPGITIRGAGLDVTTHDVLIQHLRIRVGDNPNGPEPDTRDAIQILGPNGKRVVIDHCSFSWAIDENTSTWYDGVEDITFSNNIISEGLLFSLHSKGAHSKGLLVGYSTKRIAVIGNLFAHNDDRNPFIQNDVTGISVNNVFYNWGRGSTSATYLGQSEIPVPGFQVSIIGNSYIKGPDTGRFASAINVDPAAPAGSQAYLSDNRMENVSLFYDSSIARSGVIASRPPIWTDPLTVRPSRTVEDYVLTHAGARRSDGDIVDARIVSEVRKRTGHLINSQTQVGGWPTLAVVTRPAAIPPNPDGTSAGEIYTNLDRWLHDMATEVEKP